MRVLKLLTVFLFIIVSCKEQSKEVMVAQIIPKPLHQKINEGQFVLSSKTGLVTSEEFKISTNFLIHFLSDFNLKEGNAGLNTIQFINDETINNTEGYILEITPKSIKISAKTDQAAFYAVQSLRQLLPVSFENKITVKSVAIPCLKIEDEPKFKYRGMHLDVVRHMYSVAFIKKYIDALELLNILWAIL